MYKGGLPSTEKSTCNYCMSSYAKENREYRLADNSLKSKGTQHM